MKLKLAFYKLLLGCVFLLIFNTKFTSSVEAEESQKIELNKEIKKEIF